MTDTRTTQVQDEILNTVRKGQTAVVDAIQTWASAVQSITPSLPEMKLPEFSLPFADKLPRPQDLVASAYDFAEQLLASQRKFAEEILKVTAPMLPGTDEAPARKNGTAAK
jgi:hypothetical protein